MSTSTTKQATTWEVRFSWTEAGKGVFVQATSEVDAMLAASEKLGQRLLADEFRADLVCDEIGIEDSGLAGFEFDEDWQDVYTGFHLVDAYVS